MLAMDRVLSNWRDRCRALEAPFGLDVIRACRLFLSSSSSCVTGSSSHICAGSRNLEKKDALVHCDHIIENIKAIGTIDGDIAT